MNTLLAVIRYTITVSNLLMIACLGYFSNGLNWNVEKDRSSIIGFAWMALTITGSVILIWI